MRFYNSFAESAQGYNHIKADKECQDASISYSDEKLSVIAIADGHGGDNYPRTAKGSYYAVCSAVNAIKSFVNTLIESGETLDLNDSKNMQLNGLAKNILMNWHDYIDEDVAQNPFNEEDFKKVSDKYKDRYLSGNYNSKAYGTTLIAVCITENYWFGLQIGDGKCVAIDELGCCYEPIPWDEQCQSNVTTSICDSDAIEEFRFCKGSEFPLAVFAGCDGIDDSYAGDEELYSFYQSLLFVIAENGIEVGIQEVKEFLPKLSRKGSGDDVSIAGLIEQGVSMHTIELIKTKVEYNKALARKEQLEKECKISEDKVAYINDAYEKAKKSIEDTEEKRSKIQAEYERKAAERATAIKAFEEVKEKLENIKLHD